MHRIFLVEEIKTQLDRGTQDEELMKAYRLSSDELRGLFDRLIRAVASGSDYVQVEAERDPS